MKPMFLRITAVVMAGALAVASGSFAFAQKADVPAKAQAHRYLPLSPNPQPREANGTDNRVGPYAKEIRPTDREMAVDRRINNICRGC